MCFDVAMLLASSIAPHFAEHIRRGPWTHPPLRWPRTIRARAGQERERGPAQTQARDYTSNARSFGATAEELLLLLLKKLGKTMGGQPSLDPKEPLRGARLRRHAPRFLECQDAGPFRARPRRQGTCVADRAWADQRWVRDAICAAVRTLRRSSRSCHS